MSWLSHFNQIFIEHAYKRMSVSGIKINLQSMYLQQLKKSFITQVPKLKIQIWFYTIPYMKIRGNKKTQNLKFILKIDNEGGPVKHEMKNIWPNLRSDNN